VTSGRRFLIDEIAGGAVARRGRAGSAVARGRREPAAPPVRRVRDVPAPGGAPAGGARGHAGRGAGRAAISGWRLLIGAPVVGLALLGLGLVAFTHEKAPGSPSARSGIAYAVVQLPAVTLNLSGDDGYRFVKVQVALVMRGPMDAGALARAAKERTPALLDGLTRAIVGQRYTAMQEPAGNRALRQVLQSRFDEILAPAQVVRVYFKEFAAA